MVKALGNMIARELGCDSSDSRSVFKRIKELKRAESYKSTAEWITIRERAESDRLRAAIEETLDENAHLADGDDCTLAKLKKAASVNMSPSELYNSNAVHKFIDRLMDEIKMESRSKVESRIIEGLKHDVKLRQGVVDDATCQVCRYAVVMPMGEKLACNKHANMFEVEPSMVCDYLHTFK